MWFVGSVARGTADSAGDVDLLVLRPSSVPEDISDWTAQISTLEDHIQSWTRNEAKVTDYGEHELSSLVQAPDRFVGALRADAITIASASVPQRCRARSGRSAPRLGHILTSRGAVPDDECRCIVSAVVHRTSKPALRRSPEDRQLTRFSHDILTRLPLPPSADSTLPKPFSARPAVGCGVNERRPPPERGAPS